MQTLQKRICTGTPHHVEVLGVLLMIQGIFRFQIELSEFDGYGVGGFGVCAMSPEQFRRLLSRHKITVRHHAGDHPSLIADSDSLATLNFEKEQHVAPLLLRVLPAKSLTINPEGCSPESIRGSGLPCCRFSRPIDPPGVSCFRGSRIMCISRLTPFSLICQCFVITIVQSLAFLTRFLPQRNARNP